MGLKILVHLEIIAVSIEHYNISVACHVGCSASSAYSEILIEREGERERKGREKEAERMGKWRDMERERERERETERGDRERGQRDFIVKYQMEFLYVFLYITRYFA